MFNCKQYFLVIVYLTTSLVTSSIYSQTLTAPGEDIICYASGETHRSYIGASINASEKSKGARILTVNPFEVDYINVPVAGQNVISYATDIWSEIINSPFPIKISVTWKELGEGTLGSARPASRKANFIGAPIQNVWYPIALAERLARKELNEADEYEIIISLNQEFAWYFGIDGQVSEGTHDLLSVVLHEIGHGLGLSDTFNSDGGNGSWGYITRANVYDYYIINTQEEQLIDTDIFKNYSSDLNRQITSNRLQYASYSANSGNNAEFPKIYAPYEFNGGSSISHLDEETYPAGDTNSLMTPQISREEAIHNTGPLINGILADMGYAWTFIDHDSVPDQADWNQDVLITGKISSDSILNADSSFIYYSFDEFISTQKAPLLLNTGQTEFNTTIPSAGFKTYVDFYFSVTGNNNVTYRSPTNTKEPNYRFGFGLVTGIEENNGNNDNIAIYPNPTNGLIQLKYELRSYSEKAKVVILNLQGNIIYQNNLKVTGASFEHKIDLSNQAPGVYVLQVQDRKNIFSKPVIVK